MKLQYALPVWAETLPGIVPEEVRYCVPYDLTAEGRFLRDGYLAVTRERLFVLEGGRILRDIPLPPAQLRELFVMSSLSSDIGSIPNTLDQVSIGSADRMRPNQPKISFVMGLNLGEFPPQLSENGLFSETERDRLQESGIQLNPSVIKLSDYEKYYL